MGTFAARIKELWQQARGLRMVVSVLAQHRLRTVLATLGVFLGALLLTGILHILEAINMQMQKEAVRLGSHVITITAAPVSFIRQDTVMEGKSTRTAPAASTDSVALSGNKASKERARSGSNAASGTGSGSPQQPVSAKQTRIAATLSKDDINEAVAALPQLVQGTPFILANGRVALNGTSLSCQLMGITTAYTGIWQYYPKYGRFFTGEEDAQQALVCVLGMELAKRFFSDPKDAVGQYLQLHKSTVLVVGVMEEKGVDAGGTKLDEMVFIPVTTYMQRFSSMDHFSGAFLELRDRREMALVKTALVSLLRKNHHLEQADPDDFSISLSEQVDQFVGNALQLVRTLGYIGAAISFSIGTLGILSIMTLLVQSRRLEIGIRRAVGATRKNILAQFIGEAAIMAAIGGVLGVLTALGLSALLYSLGVLPAYYSMLTTFAVCVLSIVCGITAGAYPAWQAAKTDVLSVLRSS